MKTTFLITFGFLLIQANGFAQKTQKKEKDNLLVNKTYTVEFTETGAKKPKPISDEISFKADKLGSKFMTTENKFTASAYTAGIDSSSSGKDIFFQSDSKNSEGEELKWQGIVSGESIEGTAIISKKGKTKKEYSFSGNLKQKNKK